MVSFLFIFLDILDRLPLSPNHIIFLAFIILSFFISLLVSYIRSKKGFSVDSFVNNLFPVIRVEVLILYFWAALSKLNPQFFDYDISCATLKLFEINQVLPILPSVEWYLKINPYLIFLLEISIPICLLINRARVLGIILGFILHFGVGLKHTGFTLLMFSLYSLFLPDEYFYLIQKQLLLIKNKFASIIQTKKRYIYWAIELLILLILLKLISFMMGGTEIRLFLFSREGFYMLSFCIFFILFIYYLVKYLKGESNSINLGFIPNNKALVILPIILFPVGLFPYLGIKNIQVFTMFSNLSTENGKSNHFFIPASIQVFDNLSDLIHIKSSSLGGIDKFSGPVVTRPLRHTEILLPRNYIKYQKSKDKNVQEKYYFAIPYMQISNLITELSKRGVKNIEIEFVRRDRVYNIKNAENHPELSTASLLQRKILGLRAVPVNNPGVCMW